MNTDSKRNALPLYFRTLEADEQANRQAGSFQVIEALGDVFIRKPVDAFELEDEFVVHDDVGDVIANVDALVFHWESGLRVHIQPTHTKFGQQRAFVDFFKKPSAQRV